MGQALFRNKNGISLTHAGHTYYTSIEPIYMNLQKIIDQKNSFQPSKEIINCLFPAAIEYIFTNHFHYEKLQTHALDENQIIISGYHLSHIMKYASEMKVMFDNYDVLVLPTNMLHLVNLDSWKLAFVMHDELQVFASNEYCMHYELDGIELSSIKRPLDAVLLNHEINLPISWKMTHLLNNETIHIPINPILYMDAYFFKAHAIANGFGASILPSYMESSPLFMFTNLKRLDKKYTYGVLEYNFLYNHKSESAQNLIQLLKALIAPFQTDTFQVW